MRRALGRSLAVANGEGRDARRAARVLLRAQLKGALLTDDRSLLKAFAQHAAAWKASLGSEWKPFITQDVLKTLVDAAKTLEICEDEDYQRWQVVDASRVVASIGVRGDDGRWSRAPRPALRADAAVLVDRGGLGRGRVFVLCLARPAAEDDGLPAAEAASNAAIEVLACASTSSRWLGARVLARAPLPPLASLTFEAARQKTTVVEQPAPLNNARLAGLRRASGSPTSPSTAENDVRRSRTDARRQAAGRAGDDLPGPRGVREARGWYVPVALEDARPRLMMFWRRVSVGGGRGICDTDRGSSRAPKRRRVRLGELSPAPPHVVGTGGVAVLRRARQLLPEEAQLLFHELRQ